MAKIPDKDRVAADQKRIGAASSIYREWEDKWSPKMLEEYYYGDQWQGESGDWADRKYVINLFNASIEISKPSLLFQVPKYKVTARINRVDDPKSDAASRAKLQEETLNSFVQDPKLGFAIEAGLGLLDSQFRFAVMQVGYTADFVDNPNAGKPMLGDEVDLATGEPKPMVGSDGKEVTEPKFTLRDEGLFIKWVSAKQCRFSERNGNRSEDCDWFAYYEWHYADDLKQNPRYDKRATAKLTATGRAKTGKDTAARADEDDVKPGMVKVWFKWDFRQKERRIWAEGGEKYLLEEPYKFLPFAFLKFNEILGQWLPLPVAYNWVHPQNQLNDMREARRVHRQRSKDKFLRRANAFENEEEFEKLLSEEEGVSAIVQGDPNTAVATVPRNASDPALFRDEQTVLEDFTRISGISGESQQVAQSETATQANLIALMGQTRENSKRMVVGQWLSAIGRLILLTIKENMALPFWIKKAVDPKSPLAALEAQEVAKLWRQIESEDIGEIDNDITVDLSSLSPVQQAQERQDFLAFLQIITSPAMGMVLLASPALFRKVAGMFNIHDERDLQELGQAVQSVMMTMAQQQAQKQGVSMPGAPAPGPTPSGNDIMGQLKNQLPTEQVASVQ